MNRPHLATLDKIISANLNPRSFLAGVRGQAERGPGAGVLVEGHHGAVRAPRAGRQQDEQAPQAVRPRAHAGRLRQVMH